MSAQPVEQRVDDPLAVGWVPPAEPVAAPRHLLPVPPPVPDAVTDAVRGLLLPSPRPAEPPAVAVATAPPAPTEARPEPSHDDLAELRQVALAALRDLARD